MTGRDPQIPLTRLEQKAQDAEDAKNCIEYSARYRAAKFAKKWCEMWGDYLAKGETEARLATCIEESLLEAVDLPDPDEAGGYDGPDRADDD